MTILNLQVNASANDAHQTDGLNNEGKTFSSTAVANITSTTLAPGSHADGDEWSAGVRFANVTIPQGATIVTATLKLTPTETFSGSPNVIKYHVSGHVNDNASAFAASAGNLNATTRPRTTASAVADLTSVTIDVEVAIDVTAAIQEIINRAGWASGNALALLIDTHADTTTADHWQTFHAYDGSTTKAAKLDIDYSAGGGGSSNAYATIAPYAITATIVAA